MATAKKTRSKAAANNGSGPPKGMKQIVGGYAKTWNVEDFDTLQGTISDPPKTVELTQGKKKTERQCVEVTDDDGERYTVWESAGLVPLFNVLADEGTSYPLKVWIQFRGYGTAKKGQNAPKLFDSAIG